MHMAYKILPVLFTKYLKILSFSVFLLESSGKNHNTFLLKAAVMQIEGVLKSQRFNTLSCSVLEFIFGV